MPLSKSEISRAITSSAVAANYQVMLLKDFIVFQYSYEINKNKNCLLKNVISLFRNVVRILFEVHNTI